MIQVWYGHWITWTAYLMRYFVNSIALISNNLNCIELLGRCPCLKYVHSMIQSGVFILFSIEYLCILSFWLMMSAYWFIRMWTLFFKNIFLFPFNRNMFSFDWITIKWGKKTFATDAWILFFIVLFRKNKMILISWIIDQIQGLQQQQKYIQ